jgi:hypothetical protein
MWPRIVTPPTGHLRSSWQVQPTKHSFVFDGAAVIPIMPPAIFDGNNPRGEGISGSVAPLGAIFRYRCLDFAVKQQEVATECNLLTERPSDLVKPLRRTKSLVDQLAP